MRTGLMLVGLIGMVVGCGNRDGGGGGIDAGRDGSPGGGTRCGPAVCGEGSRCCDRCSGACVPEESGAFCPSDDPTHQCDAGPGGVQWTSCAEAHGSAMGGERCSFTGSCGNCCCEGSTSCVDGVISIALCDCPCVPDDAGP